MSMGRRLQQRMKRRRMTVAQVAADAELSESTVRGLMHGETNVLLANVAAVAAAVGTSVGCLVDGGWGEAVRHWLRRREWQDEHFSLN